MKQIICKECGKIFSSPENLGKHVKCHNISREEYYIKWNKKDENEGACKICGNSTKFLGVNIGYAKYCSLKCKREGAGKKTSKTWENRKMLKKQSFKFKCLECSETFETSLKLQRHIISKHISQLYFDKYFKQKGDGICKICEKPTKFYNLMTGYKQCCSNKCSNQYRYDNRTKTNLKKYGVKNPFESKEVQKKIKETFVKNYGVDNNMKSKKGRDVYKKSMVAKYGVEWPLQDKGILDKNQKSAKTLKQYKDTSLWYQGSYEKEFLDLYLDKYPDMERGPSIRYKFKNKNKVYHSDFYIPSLNLVIEIKSSWILKADIEIKEKKKATIANGFNYLMILDKKYPNLLIK